MIYFYHHNDDDGYAAAAYAARYELFLGFGLRVSDFTFYPVAYANVLPGIQQITSEDKVYFLDYSFSNVATRTQLLSLIRDVHPKIVWIDHHKTSIEWYNEIKKDINHDNLKVILSTEYSATMLTYLYLSAHISKPNELREFKEYISTKTYYGEDESVGMDEFFQTLPPLKFLSFIDDWDCWVFQYPQTYYMHYGLNMLPNKWKQVIREEDGTEYLNPSWDIVWVTDDQTLELKHYYDLGKQIAAYQETMDLITSDHIFLINFHGLEVAALNGRGNSNTFGAYYHRYDACLLFSFTGAKWQYSLYSHYKDGTVDCAEIAKSYGGGGHLGAAGWVSDKLLEFELIG